MVRTQIQLNEKQAKLLKKLSAEREQSISALVRQAVDMLADSMNKPDAGALKKRAIAASGRFRSKEGDVSVNHDKYLAEDFL